MTTDDTLTPFPDKAAQRRLEEECAELNHLSRLFLRLESGDRRQLVIRTCEILLDAEQREKGVQS